MAAFAVRGQILAGLAVLRNHLSYLPLSGSALTQLEDELAAYEMTRSALRVPVEQPPPRPPVKQLIDARLREIDRP